MNLSVTISPSATLSAISGVTANVSSLGGSATLALSGPGGPGTYTATYTIPVATAPGSYPVSFTASDSTPVTPLTETVSATPVAVGTTETWSGANHGTDSTWSDPLNWATGAVPGTGDILFFDNLSGQDLTPSMDISVSAAGLYFVAGAASFNITTADGSTLTLTGGVTNLSSNPQILNVPIVESATHTVAVARRV